jgi:tetratricopeptide (TPR) repeat protein
MTAPLLNDVHDPLTIIARDPHSARAQAELLLDTHHEPGPRSIALRLLGLALRECGDGRGSVRALRQAAAVAARAGLTESAAHARASRLGALALRGGGGVSGTTLSRMAAAAPSARALLHAHHGIAAAQRGDFSAAVGGFDAALAGADAVTRARLLPGVLSNRGLALMYCGRFAEAADDLDRALAAAEAHALDYLRGVALQNLGCLAVRRGDLPTAVARFTSAARLVPDSRRSALRLDHADALLSAGMVRDAARLVDGLAGGDGGTAAEDATARLLRAKIHLSRGERRAACGEARRVRADFAADSLWSELARLVEWSARHIAEPRPRPIRPVRPRRPSRGTTESPGAVLGPVSGGTARAVARCVPSAPLGPLSLAVPSPRHTAALRALADGDHAAARHVLRRGPAPVAAPVRHLDLLAHAGAHQREVAAVGAGLALRHGSGATALEWAEYGRALRPAAGPCRDAAWARLLERCRAAHAAARVGDGAARAELGRLTAGLAAAQWHSGCVVSDGPGAVPGAVAAGLADRLGDRAFLCHIDADGVHAAVTVAGGRIAVHRLDGAAAAGDAAARLRYAARMGVLAPGSGAAGAARSAAEVDRLLIAPVRAEIGDRPLVLSPASYAHGLPWGLLPSLRGREVSVAPSAGAWLAREGRARRAAHRPRRFLVAAGPDLASAGAEARGVGAARPGAVVRVGRAAAVADVLADLGRADLAHLAAHGAVSTDVPMLSGLLLADGAVFGYDLELLPRVPDLTVLSSCWVGGAAPTASGIVLGFGAALLALGGAAVVAGVLPVDDGAVAGAMARFHAALAAGAGPARAVADHLAPAGFVCFGAG